MFCKRHSESLGHYLPACLLIALAAMFFTNGIFAQSTANPTAAAARKEAAEVKKAEAEARKAELEAREKELELLSATKRDAGSRDKDSGSMIETQISAYKAVACAANVINARIIGLQNRIGSLMIYNRRFVNTLSEYSVMMYRLKSFDTKYKDLFAELEKKPAPTQPPVKSLDFINPFEQIRNLTIDTLALFRTDTSIEGTAVIVGKDEFIAKVVNNLSVDVYYPDKAIPVITESSPLLTKLSDLASARLKAEDALSYLNKSDDLYFQLQALNEQYDRTLVQFSIASAARPAGIKDRISKTEFDALADGENSLRPYYTISGDIYVFDQRIWAEDHGSLSGLNIIDYLQAETAYQRLTSSGAGNNFWLDVDVAETGSNMRSKSSPVVDIFTGGKRLAFSGGAVVSYRIFDLNGKVLASDTILTYMPFKKSRDITEYVCSATNTNFTL